MSIYKVENTSISNFIWKELLIIIPLGLCLIDLPLLGGTLNTIILLFISVIAFFLFFENISSIWDKNLVYLVLYLSFYVFFLNFNAFYESTFSYIVLLSAPPSFYILGKYLYSKYHSYKIIYFLVFFLIFLFFIGTFIINVRDVFENGFMTHRVIKKFSSSGDVSATVASARFAVNVSLVSVLFVKSNLKYEKDLKFLVIFFFLIGIFSVSNMISRTGLFISIVSILSMFKLMSSKEASKAFFILLIVLLILFLIAQFFNFFKWFEKSQMYYRLFDEAQESGKVPRIFRWGAGAKGLFEYPWGGKQTVIEGLFMHNLWLDVGWKVGVIPLFFLLIFSIRYIQTVWKVINYHFLSPFFRSIALCISIGFLMTFMVEPIMEGFFVNFCLFCFFFGIFEVVKSMDKEKGFIV